MSETLILRAGGLLPIAQPPIVDGGMVVAKGLIQAVGPWNEIRRHHVGPVQDLGPVWVLPGWVNAHCHLDYTDMGGLLPPPRSFSDWIKGLLALKANW